MKVDQAMKDQQDVREQEEIILDSLDRFLEKEVAPHVRKLEHEDIYPVDIVEKMKEMGLFGCIIGEEYGGLGLPTTTYARVIERMSRTWMSLSGIINSHLIMASAVQRAGTQGQKAEFLPRSATGELRGGIGLTEPDCGTDLQAIRMSRGAKTRSMSSMARRHGSPIPCTATALRCWSKPIPPPNRATRE